MKENGIAKKTASSVPGLSNLPFKDGEMWTPYTFLKSRRELDGAEGLWRIRNSLYDLENFVKFHPGGQDWIRLTKGTDITELFESHHLTDRAERLLPKYYVREANSKRSVPLTFEPNGFYLTFKKRALESLKGVDFHRPSAKSNLIADLLATSAIFFCLTAAYLQSYLALLPAGIFLSWTTIIGHNYFHMRDNFRMYYFDLGTLSSREWRISHVLSHHTYPNTIWDYEVYTAEPFLNWLTKEKSIIKGIVTSMLSPFFWSLLFFEQMFKRYYAVFFEIEGYHFRDAVPFLLPIAMSFFAPTIGAAIKTWLLVVMMASFVFSMIGFNAAHHHPDIFHDGDIFREDLDWGLLEVDAVRGRNVVDESDFLALTNFGQHCLHHLLPTVDHSYLHLCQKAYDETCKEFGLTTKTYTQWELVKGQFKQLLRTQPKKNHR